MPEDSEDPEVDGEAPPLPRRAPLRGATAFKLSVSSILSRVFRIWLSNFVPFTLLAVLIGAPAFFAIWGLVVAFGHVLDEETFSLVADGTNILTRTLLSGGLTYTVFHHLKGRRVTIGDSLRVGVRRLFPVLVVGILVAIVVFLGTLACLVPGIVAQCALFVAAPVCVVERPGISASMKRSVRLTEGNRGPIYLLTIAIIALTWGGLFLLAWVLQAFEVSAMKLDVTLSLAGTLGSGIFAVVQSVVYYDLRLGKEGVEVDDLVAVFE